MPSGHMFNWIQVYTMSKVQVIGSSMTLTCEDLKPLDGLKWHNDQVSGRINFVKLPLVLIQVCNFSAWFYVQIDKFYFNLIA